MNELKKEMMSATSQEAESIMLLEDESEQESRTLGFINDNQKCNDVLAWYGLINDEEQELLKYRDNEVERINRFTDSKLKSLTNRRNFFDIAVKSYLQTCKGKSLSLQSGKIGTRKSPDRAIIEDEPKFLKWVQSTGLNNLIKTIQKPVLQEVKKHIQETGEVMPGTDYVEGKPKFYVKPNEE